MRATNPNTASYLRTRSKKGKGLVLHGSHVWDFTGVHGTQVFTNRFDCPSRQSRWGTDINNRAGPPSHWKERKQVVLSYFHGTLKESRFRTMSLFSAIVFCGDPDSNVVKFFFFFDNFIVKDAND